MHFTELPTLGLGLAADVSSTSPDFRPFIGTDADHVDYLNFGAHYVQLPRVKHYLQDLVEAGFPMIFHPINFNIATSDDEDLEYVNAISDIMRFANAKWAGEDAGIWRYEGQYLGSFLLPVILDEESVKETSVKARRLNELLPAPFLIENPPVCFSLEQMHMLEFMRRVSEEADCGMVLDIGHLIGYQQATNRKPEDMPIDDFPFDRIVEVHLAGLQFSHAKNATTILDQHSYPVHELCWQFFERFLPRMTGLRGVTLEQEYCDEELVRKHVQMARKILDRIGVCQNAR